MKHLGIEEIIEAVLDRMVMLKIILVGDYAKGIDSGNIEVLLIGKNLDTEYISQIEDKIEKLIDRNVTFSLSNKFQNNLPHNFI